MMNKFRKLAVISALLVTPVLAFAAKPTFPVITVDANGALLTFSKPIEHLEITSPGMYIVEFMGKNAVLFIRKAKGFSPTNSAAYIQTQGRVQPEVLLLKPAMSSQPHIYHFS